MKQKKPKLQKRIICFTIAFTVILAGLGINTAVIQLVRGDKLKAMALEQQTSEKEIMPRRGTIYDRNMKELAVSANVETVVADPTVIAEEKNADQVADTLAPILEMDRNEIYELVTKDSHYVVIKKRIESEPANQIRRYLSGTDENGQKLSEEELTGKNLTGVDLIEDTKRYYPFGDFASHIIGFTGTDNQGLEGLEATYDKYLKGKSGRIIQSGGVSSSPFDYEEYYNAEDGSNLVLTIDETIQHFVEKHLEQAYIDQQVKAGACAIVMNPKNGEILAMATQPSFDLNAPRTLTDPAVLQELEGLEGDEYNKRASEELQKLWRNKAVVDTYEPGSTFKLITCATALETKASTLEDVYSCTGVKIVGGTPIHCWKTSGHGSQTFLQGMVASCNPVLMSVGERIGRDAFYKSFQAFGFRETTDFELPGEAVGSFFEYNNFNTVELATTSFGQGFTVTPLQMVSAVSALVNGGVLYRPHIVKKITDSENVTIEETTPEVIRQPISKETSDAMRYVMEQVIVQSGSTAAVEGYRIGGKSGTSEKQPRGQGNYIASFVAAAPIDDPQIVCLLLLDEPMGDQYYGGQISAPVVAKIMEETLQYYGIEPQYSPEEEEKMETTVPNVVGKTAQEAEKALAGFNLSVRVSGSGQTVSRQDPAEGAHVREGSTVTIYMENEEEGTTTVVVPNVIGKNSSGGQ